MKKIATIFMALASLAFLSCSKQDIDGTKPVIEPGNPSDVLRVFYAVTPASDSTRTFLDADLQMYWSAGDEISVFGSTVNEEYVFAGRPGEVESRFEKKGGALTGAHFSKNYAVYPYNAANSCAKEGELNVILPAEQSYVEGGFGVGDNTMVAVTENWDDNTLKFRNACGYIMLKLYGGDIIRSITFRGNNAEKLAGKALIKAGYGKEPVITMSDGATTEITMDCGEEGVATGTDKNRPTTFLFVVPPTTFEKGFTFDIVNTAGGHTAISTAKTLAISQNKVKQMAAVKVDCMHGKDIISFALTDGTNSYPAFEIGSNTISIQVPNGTDMTGLKAVFTHNGAKVSVNGVTQKSGENGHNFSDFCNSVKYTVTAGDGSTKDYKVNMYDLPVVVVETENGAAITSKENYVNCSIRILEYGKETIVDEASQIKGRGNSTWKFSKKPYNFKLGSKASVLGMPKHKKWCLLANYCDRTLLRNEMCQEIARYTGGLGWVVKGRFVDVILNGKQVGTYWLCEKVEVDANRVNIDKENGYLLEYDSYEDDYRFKTELVSSNIKRTDYVKIKSPVESAEEDPEGSYMNALKAYINELESILSKKTAGNYREYLDVESSAYFLLFQELVGNWDVSYGNSCYMYKDVDAVLHAGPVWDFDIYTFSNNYKKQHWATKGMYYPQLLNDNYFKAAVKRCWTVMKEKMESGYIDNYVNEAYASIKHSALRDASIWPVSSKYAEANYNGDNGLTIEAAKDRLITVFHEQIVWLDSWVKSLVVDQDSFSGTTDDYSAQQDKRDDFNFGF